MASNPAETPDHRRTNHSADESDRTEALNENIITIPESPTSGREVNRVAFKEPSDHEATYYYAAFPSQPRLLGRTSSATTPWFYNEDWPPKYRYYHSGPEDALNSATAAGPVGPHPIHASWETGTRGKVINALSPIPWTSIDVLRIGRTTIEENKRPVIVWVGVASQAAEAGHVPWSLVSIVLKRVRHVLDSDGLQDVECELRVSDVSHASGTRLRQRQHDIDRRSHSAWELTATHAVSTSLGQAVSPANNPNFDGTLGLYLAPDASMNDDAIWALTCYHVVLPDLSESPANRPNREAEAGGSQLGKQTSANTCRVNVLLPVPSVIESCLKPMRDVVASTENEFKNATAQQGLQAALQMPTHKTLLRQRELVELLEAFAQSNENCVIGFVEHAPPIRITTDPRYTRDWALIALDRNRFPTQFTFPNVVDLETDLPGPPVKTAVEKVLGCAPDALPADGMMRLRGIIPLREQRGAHILHPWTTMCQDDSRPIVFKRGRSTGITVGLALDIQSTTRAYLREGIMEQESYEWAIIHASGIDKNREPAKKIQSFTEAGDSGSVVFDITGRIGGLVVRGTNHAMRHLQGYDITYATPMEHLLKDIETELGTKVRIL
ncbi:hypothetical protein SPBR_08923 [Sporothrix brasiliensis 5110]|uniref:Uncharacterized protein n=1 Tax=Sporothrix brasiliensis 5110 TaxID=1398154 RepID=A0A0C2ENN2_9PEZI|nr:uncharacterized protein SPBR_08923 [Sporothrix brasiliensis 5110]KIH87724.1 hypothetical protein SPBR_08923 [Sporothrix brasiliensis 5110]